MRNIEFKGFRIFAFLALISTAFLACSSASVEPSYDIVIKGAKVIDGSGNPWFYGDIGTKGDTILAIGDLDGKAAGLVIDARGLVVSPGFIDMHSHCDWGLGRPETRANLNYVTQGVTTVVTGNCGQSPLAIAETAAQWDKNGIGTNAAILLGLGQVREAVMGNEMRAPNAREMTRMKAMVETAMGEGAFGVSTGLQYVPGRYTTTEELIELAGAAAPFGGIYSTHMRSEEEKLIPAIEEAIRISEKTGLRLNISHLKSSARPNWGQLKEAVRLVSEARSRGTEVTADIYAYNKSATASLEDIFNIPVDLEPLAGMAKRIASPDTPIAERRDLDGRYAAEVAKALADPVSREKIRKLTETGVPDRTNWVAKGGWENFTIMFSRTKPEYVGRMFCDLAKELKKPEFDIAADLYVAEGRDFLITLSTMSEDDVRLGLSQPWAMISSDGLCMDPASKERVHPRNYAAFTRVLSEYVRDNGLLSLENAVRKMTSLPAQTLRLKDRGMIREGAKADLVVFDPAKVRDKATFLEPRQYSTGIEYVLINGRLSVEKGVANGALNGRTILKSGRGQAPSTSNKDK